MSALIVQHLMACKKVLRYLRATQDHGPKFIKEEIMKLTSFTNAEWECDLDNMKLVGAYCIYLGNNL